MNDSEFKELLELTKENNKLLRKMRRSAMIGGVIRLIYWVAIIGTPIFLYYSFLQPYLAQLLDIYSQVQGGAENLQNVGSQGLGGLFQKFGIGQ